MKEKAAARTGLSISPLSTQDLSIPLLEYAQKLARAPRALRKAPRRKAPDQQPCCLVRIVARDSDVANVRESTLRPPGAPAVRIFLSGQKHIDFTVTVGRAEDVAKINVIQYLKNVRYTWNGVAAQPDYGPRNQPWKWEPGADGYRVDQVEDIRCLPELQGDNGGTNPGQNQAYGLNRNPQARTVTWFDEPGLDIAQIRTLFNDGTLTAASFPLVLSAEFKTDILCSEVNPCRRESAEARQALEQVWANSVVGRVTWELSVTVERFAVGGASVFASRANNKPQITNIQTSILLRCQENQ